MTDVVERVRMAVAEAGFDPSLIGGPTAPHATHSASRSLPLEVRWRAREVALAGGPRCLACHGWMCDWRDARGGYLLPACPCIAERRFTQDCGAERPS